MDDRPQGHAPPHGAGLPGAANMLTSEGKPKKFGRKRVGFMGHTKPARPGADIYSADGTTKVGTVRHQ